MTEDTSIQALKDRHLGETAWIVGKGPSLVMLSKDDLGTGPVIALNEAVIHIESLGVSNPIYSMQKDADDYELTSSGWVPNMAGETFVPISRAALLVHAHEAPNRLSDYRPRYVFDNVADFALEWWDFSVLSATAAARLMGCRSVVYVSLDASVSGDSRICVPRADGSFEVLRALEHEEYTDHRYRIDDYLARVALPAEWLTPGRSSNRHPDQQSLVHAVGRAVDRLGSQVHVRGREIDRLFDVTESLRCEQGRLRVELDESRGETRAKAAAASESAQEVERLTGALEESGRDKQRLTAELVKAASEAGRWLGLVTERATEIERLMGLIEDHRRERNRLTLALERTQGEAGRLAGTLEDRTHETERLTSALQESVRENRRLTDALAHANAEVSSLIAVLTEAHAQTSTARADLAAARHDVEALRASASWRWMAPLRAAKRVLTGAD